MNNSKKVSEIVLLELVKIQHEYVKQMMIKETGNDKDTVLTRNWYKGYDLAYTQIEHCLCCMNEKSFRSYSSELFNEMWELGMNDATKQEMEDFIDKHILLCNNEMLFENKNAIYSGFCSAYGEILRLIEEKVATEV